MPVVTFPHLYSLQFLMCDVIMYCLFALYLCRCVYMYVNHDPLSSIIIHLSDLLPDNERCLFGSDRYNHECTCNNSYIAQNGVATITVPWYYYCSLDRVLLEAFKVDFLQNKYSCCIKFNKDTRYIRAT